MAGAATKMHHDLSRARARTKAICAFRLYALKKLVSSVAVLHAFLLGSVPVLTFGAFLLLTLRNAGDGNRADGHCNDSGECDSRHYCLRWFPTNTSPFVPSMRKRIPLRTGSEKSP